MMARALFTQQTTTTATALPGTFGRIPALIPRSNIWPTCTRYYASPTFTEDEVKLALERAFKSRRGNLPSPSKIYFYEVYRRIIQSRGVFVLQNNNMTALEYKQAKMIFKQAGFGVTSVRVGLFKAALLDHQNEVNLAKLDKTDKEAAEAARLLLNRGVDPERRNRRVKVPGDLGMRALRVGVLGPTVVAFSNAEDKGTKLVNSFLKLMEDSGLKKMNAVGGMVDGEVYTLDQIKKVSEMPTKERLREELVGVLSAPAARLAGILQQTPMSLLVSLSSHERTLKEKEGGGGSPDASEKKDE